MNDQIVEDPGFLRWGSELATLISTFDWAATTLGPISGWPSHLKTSVAIALRSPVPIVMLWGPDGVMLYNDAYAAFADKRHPDLLGAKVLEAWPEVADFNRNVLMSVLSGGTLSYRDQELTLYRRGVPEQVWLDLDYSPIVDEEGTAVGVFAIVAETTAKNLAEREVANERERLKQMFSQAPSFMALLSGPEHVFDFVNEAYGQLIGHRDVSGKTVQEALPEIESQGYYELLDKVYSTGEPFVGNAWKVSLQRTSDAPPEERLVDFIFQPVRNVQGDVDGIFVEGIDVTERKIAERALRASEQQFRTFAEAMPNHVWTAPLDGKLDWFNNRVYEYSGATPGDLAGEGWAKIVHPHDLLAASELWQQSVTTGEPYEVEFRLRRKDGQYRWHIGRAVLIRDSHEGPSRWIGTNTDIEDQKQVLRQLIDSERRLRLSQRAAGIASMEVDIASGEVFGSDHFWQLFGLEPRPSIATSEVEALILPADRHVRSSDETRRAGTAATDVEYRIRRPDTAAVRWISRNMEFQLDDAGRPIKMFGVLRDITEKKDSDARQSLLTHELEHRIKNILATVAAIASQTLRGEDMDAARAALNERLRVLASAHDLLTKTRWTSASLDGVISSALAPFPSSQIDVDGPAVVIGPKRALSLALAVNELGTNSLKYGALSVPEGRVSLSWSESKTDDGEPRLIWAWRERDGPAVVPPERKGFGRFLIERVLAADFEGAVRIDFRREGVVCTLEAPWPTLAVSDKGLST